MGNKIPCSERGDPTEGVNSGSFWYGARSVEQQSHSRETLRRFTNWDGQAQRERAVESLAMSHLAGRENGSDSGWWRYTDGQANSSSTSGGGPWSDSYDETVNDPGFYEGAYYGWDYGGGREEYFAYLGDAFYDPSGPSSGSMFWFAYGDVMCAPAPEPPEGENDARALRMTSWSLTGAAGAPCGAAITSAFASLLHAQERRTFTLTIAYDFKNTPLTPGVKAEVERIMQGAMKRFGDPDVKLVIVWQQVQRVEDVKPGLVGGGRFSSATGAVVLIRDQWRGPGVGQGGAGRFSGTFNPDKVRDAARDANKPFDKVVAVCIVHEAIYHGAGGKSGHYKEEGFVDASGGGQIGAALSDEAAKLILGRFGIRK